eukprot:TRINITY_DN56353_c0_g1_i1.p1 TRINITY_DN56353_c0_g1~~TRINITY_DN56353_c0_g1_i1.p1  ORF type:complete len:704 (+),score=31.82 TRINITY_DN56353_c0_g1_i1:79-2190(+)
MRPPRRVGRAALLLLAATPPCGCGGVPPRRPKSVLEDGWGEETGDGWGAGSGLIESAAIRLWQEATRRHTQQRQDSDEVLEWYRFEHKRLEDAARLVQQTAAAAGLRPPTGPQYLPIPRVDARDLPRERFQREYALPLRPLILTGLGAEVTGGKRWDRAHFREHCGTLSFQPRQYKTNSSEWASQGAQEGITTLTLNDVFDRLHHRNKSAIFDESLSRWCPQAIENFRIPEQFAEDMLAQHPLWFGRHGAWPSLFASQQGAETGLHIDWGATQAWMLVLEGTKEFYFFHHAQSPLLYQDWDPDGNGHHHAMSRPWLANATSHPLVAAARGWRGVVGPGDVVFLPALTHHAVLNLSPTLAIAANYIDTVTMRLTLGGGGESFLNFGTEREQLMLQWRDLLARVDSGLGLAQFRFGRSVPMSRLADKRWIPRNRTDARSVADLIALGEDPPEVLWVHSTSGLAPNSTRFRIDGRYGRVYPSAPDQPLWVNPAQQTILYQLPDEHGGGWGMNRDTPGVPFRHGLGGQNGWPLFCSAPLARTKGYHVWPHEAGFWGSRAGPSELLVIDLSTRVVGSAHPDVQRASVSQPQQQQESAAGSARRPSTGRPPAPGTAPARPVSFKDRDGDEIRIGPGADGRVRLTVNGQFLTYTSRLRWVEQRNLLMFEDVGLETVVSRDPDYARGVAYKVRRLAAAAGIKPPVLGLDAA